MAVFVLDRRKKRLMPCSEKRATKLLDRGRARVHRVHPFTIRLIDRTQEDSELQPVRLKIDPGSRTTGIALVVELTDDQNQIREARTVHLAEIGHKTDIRSKMEQRRNYRRRRRSANLRYRTPRFLNRTKPKGWLPPSLKARVDGTLSWVRRYRSLAPITTISVETVRFDTQALQNPEISGVEYQQGTLFGYEVREYLLEKWERKCAYCSADDTPLQVEHIVPKSRGGSDRIPNLTLACGPCNQKKGALTAAEFGHPCIQQQAQKPLRDAAAVNSTRWALYRRLNATRLPVEMGTGGRTKFNRKRLGIPKTHALDALCVGASTPNLVTRWRMPTLSITTKGRGRYQRTLPDRSGFPRAILMRQKAVYGFQTGDLVSADVSRGKYAGHYPLAEVRVRSSGRFDLFGPEGKLAQGIGHACCRRIQQFDGYTYSTRTSNRAIPPATKPLSRL